MSDSTRKQLAAQQSELVKSLMSDAPVPPAFDAERLRIAAQALLRKRMRTVAKVWPLLPLVLGDKFAREFLDYAQMNPLPAGGAAEDGTAFARCMSGRHWLPLNLRLRIFLSQWRLLRIVAVIGMWSRD